MDNKEIEVKIKSIEKEVREWFHYLHENPELGFQEFDTAAFVEKKLKSFGNIEVRRLGDTGIIGMIDTENPGYTVAFRADMDALPIKENEDHEICSKNIGIMHACGHDGHTATLLGAAKILTEMREQLCGQIRFIFQPSEEIQPGGAIMMTDQGALDGVDYIFGLHYSIDEEPGYFSIHPGNNFAANYKFKITVQGEEGHAAFPHLAKDTVLTSAEIINALHHIVSRSIDPLESAVLSITQIHSGNTYNSIPGKAEIGGTIRFHDINNGRVLIEQAESIVTGISNAYGCKATWEIERGCDPLHNELELTKKVRKVLERTFGTDKVMDHAPVMGCEDFSEYLKTVRGVYFRVGCMTVEEDGTVYPTHNSGYRLNEQSLFYGIGGIVAVMTEFCSNEKGEKIL